VGRPAARDTSLQAIRALWSTFLILGVSGLTQVVVFRRSGSVALLGDALHNLADAATLVPLVAAFALARRPPTRRYTYGFGRAEDLAGLVVVLSIGLSAVVSGYSSIARLLDPAEIDHLGAVAVAAAVGFAGNELAARHRIRVGRRIGSAALVAEGHHARVDGLTSLAVLVGAGGVGLGMRWIDSLVGLAIAVMIAVVAVRTGRAVCHRLMDAVDPGLVDRSHRLLLGVPGVRDVRSLRMRWAGHQLHAEAEVVVDAGWEHVGHVVAEDARSTLVGTGGVVDRATVMPLVSSVRRGVELARG
jgi:cation diffusion facilitator family transporter